MKKILISMLFLTLSITVFATPYCSEQYPGQGTEMVLYDEIKGLESVSSFEINPIEFSCTINGIGAGEEYYYVLFSYVYDYTVTQNYDDKLWVPQDTPIHVTSADNGTTITHIWDAIGNQPGFEGLAVVGENAFMGICADPQDLSTCDYIKDYDGGKFSFWGYLPSWSKVENNLLTVSYAVTEEAEVDMYVLKPSPTWYNLTPEEVYGNDFLNSLGETVLEYKNLGLVYPPQNGEMHYYTFPDPLDLEDGLYYIRVRYIRKPDLITTEGHPLGFFSEGGFSVTGMEDEIKKDVFEVLNNDPGSDYVGIKVPAEYNGSTVDIYDIKGSLINSEKLQEGVNKVSKPEAKGVYMYKVKNEQKKIYQPIKVVK
ncbi:MAG: T9SS type A sorting domain-containing protein [Elusimicrobiaceae bacterium]|jgi:hypothetical protein|nr:T9SS type A sorting domain-containing protein [Elusimicrobiaceae bacterium]MBT4008171.1 T9SS type A sorting domain-containing protein [Elusimicrobiaceae bacterium]MBT4402529.1 T9SS type A sorting domain-containing protein [Elusimicrobiaceae bacterium]MBT4439656.1 T9SS type A sorting domain-containing protein [Elusimicrobiaceae bacterium]MBT5988050.1 T9SS type A sorting domain-containing protein [Elusimicrobiaceae bacterium]